jgi:hypothetical protein
MPACGRQALCDFLFLGEPGKKKDEGSNGMERE